MAGRNHFNHVYHFNVSEKITTMNYPEIICKLPKINIPLDGEIWLTISGVEKKYQKGDNYFVPEGAVHSGIASARFKAIDFFNQADRYTT
jgi:hypothetical protein